MLRGPQTAAEIRTNGERLHRFADAGAVEAVLAALADAYPSRAVKLARAPGARESRWAHLLCGDPPAAWGGPAGSADALPDLPAGEGRAVVDDVAWLRAEVQRLGQELQALQRELAAVKAELGIEASSS
jgi:uncharacterized protein YceH (UPF0502 family)